MSMQWKKIEGEEYKKLKRTVMDKFRHHDKINNKYFFDSNKRILFNISM